MAAMAIAIVAGITWLAYEMTISDPTPAPVVAPVPITKPLLPPHP